MKTSDNESDNEQVVRQDLSQEAKTSGIYHIWLLFREKCERPSTDILLEKLKERFGSVVTVADSSISVFALSEHLVTYKDNKKAPAQLMITECNKAEEPLGDDIARSQFWDCPDGVVILDSCPWRIMICDFLASGLPTLERAYILSDWLEIVLELFPTCTAIFSQASGKLLTAENARENPYSGPLRFFHFGVNARFFRIQGGNEMMVDTLGLHALGLPDMQYHFRDLDPNAVINHAYNTAIYQFENDAPIASGHTIEGVEPGSQWKCQYESSLIQPVRDILDVAAGDFAAGNRS